MRRKTGKFWTATVAAILMVGTAVWTAITTTGWPPVIPAEIPWNFILFAAFAFIAFFMLLRENLDLTTPHLELVFKSDEDPYVFDKLNNDGRTLRIYRVGVRNTGASADAVSVKLHRCDRVETGAIYPGHELWPTGQPADTLSVTIHNSGEEPLVFFDVIAQLFVPGQPSESLHMRYAAAGLHGRVLAHDTYRLTLAIHGPGADAPQEFIVEKDNNRNQWVLRKASRHG